MGFLASIVVKLLQWIMICGGEALFNYAKKKIKEHEDERTAKENLKRYEDAVKAKDDAARKSAAQDMLNGTKRK